MTPRLAATLVKEIAAQLGFERCGIAPAGPIARGDYLREWLARGWAGSMGYLRRSLQSRLDPRGLLPGARSVIVAALSYHQRSPQRPSDKPTGRIAMYAWGEDYHVVVREKLESLVANMRHALPGPFDAKVCVDTSPIVERELAAAAGVGWIGKNTLVLHEIVGSYVFLGVVLTSLELEPDAPATDHCGTCTRCLDACPTQAFPRAYQMDARRCISYLTIEHRGEIDPRFHPAIGDWVFGCDVCQQICPFNRDAPTTREPRFAPRPPGAHVRLPDVLNWDETAYREQVRGRAIDRATLAMWKRNASIALRQTQAPS